MPRVAIATAIPPDPCAFPTADHMYALGVANKQDYAQAHGWELHLSAGLIDPAVTAVSLIAELCADAWPCTPLLNAAYTSPEVLRGLSSYCNVP